MHIIVVDNNIERHDAHAMSIKQLNITNFEINESIDVDTISSIKSKIILVHKSNEEFSQIESSDNFGKIRIFFSDGYFTEYIKDEYNYYVPFEKLYHMLERVLDEIQVSGK